MTTPTIPVPTTPVHTCSAEQYTCEGGMCIFLAWVCDGERDCRHGDDEHNCGKYKASFSVVVMFCEMLVLSDPC